MPSLNFKPQFEAALLDGSKPGTVRQRRDNPIKSGDILYLFTGMRTAKCERITTKFCKTVYTIVIVQTPKKRILKINGVIFYPIMQHWFALQDGFNTTDEFFEFFRNQYGNSFVGEWIVWSKSIDELVFDYIVEMRSAHGKQIKNDVKSINTRSGSDRNVRTDQSSNRRIKKSSNE